LAILGQKSLDRFKNTFPVQNKKYSPFLSQNDKRKKKNKERKKKKKQLKKIKYSPLMSQQDKGK
jgi:hypothetical protein